MSHSSSQTFLRELDKKLWTAADKLRSNLDAAVYKLAVLGLIFLKYVSDSAKLPAGTKINMEKGRATPLNKPRTYKTTSTGKLIDDALEAVEKENPKLKNLAGFIDLIATIPFLLTNQFAKSVSLERAMKANLKGLGYAL